MTALQLVLEILREYGRVVLSEHEREATTDKVATGRETPSAASDGDHCEQCAFKSKPNTKSARTGESRANG